MGPCSDTPSPSQKKQCRSKSQITTAAPPPPQALGCLLKTTPRNTALQFWGNPNGGLSPKFSETIGRTSFRENRALSGLIGAFSGATRAFLGGIGTDSSAAHSRREAAEIPPKGPFWAQLAEDHIRGIQRTCFGSSSYCCLIRLEELTAPPFMNTTFLLCPYRHLVVNSPPMLLLICAMLFCHIHLQSSQHLPLLTALSCSSSPPPSRPLRLATPAPPARRRSANVPCGVSSTCCNCCRQRSTHHSRMPLLPAPNYT